MKTITAYSNAIDGWNTVLARKEDVLEFVKLAYSTVINANMSDGSVITFPWKSEQYIFELPSSYIRLGWYVLDFYSDEVFGDTWMIWDVKAKN